VIANYDELKAGLAELSRSYPLKLQQAGASDAVTITFAEHLPNMTLAAAYAVRTHHQPELI
jgi:hypothetical protein